MQKILQTLQNTNISETILSIHELFNIRTTLPSLLLKETPMTYIPIYLYPKELILGSSKGLQTYIELHKIPRNIAIMHALAHIEYNAMKAYLDTSIRFFYDVKAELQNEFLEDFISIANEEASHFEKLEEFLQKNQFGYGKILGLDSIREDVKKTEKELIERITVIALIQEGKGIDSGPSLLNKLRFSIIKDENMKKNIKKHEEIIILEQILKEEIGHVKNGVKWFKLLAGIDVKNRFNDIYKKFELNTAGKKIDNMN